MSKLRIMTSRYITRFAVAALFLPLLGACDKQDLSTEPRKPVPEGMMEICPTLSGRFDVIPRSASEAEKAETRVYDDHSKTNDKLKPPTLLPDGSTIWLIARNTETDKFEKNSYVVSNTTIDGVQTSFLYPCTVKEDGSVDKEEGTPLYLKIGEKYLFYCVSPARKLNETKFAEGTVGFRIKNGEAFYANDGRYDKTFPTKTVEIGPNEGADQGELVQRVELMPMINQTAQLKFQIVKDNSGYVHDLDIQPAGIQISGLQDDAPKEGIYGGPDGIDWHMSMPAAKKGEYDEPINLQYGSKSGTLTKYDYTIDADGRVNIEVPIVPMWDISKPVIVVFRLKVNGVPSAFEMMLNEKDFKAGYSYGYRGTVSIEDGVSVISWQFVSITYDVELPQ